MVLIVRDRPVHECPIWKTSEDVQATYVVSLEGYRVDASPRAGGAYVVPLALVDSELNQMTDGQKARLTSWLVGQRMKGNSQPTITKQVVDSVKFGSDLPVHERAIRLLHFIANQIDTVGDRTSLSYGDPEALAWCEATSATEVFYFLQFLQSRGLLEGNNFLGGSSSVTVTVDGYNLIAEELSATDSAQVFVAMWFNDDMSLAYEKGLAAGIREAGFNSLRIDQKEHVNRIEDEIIAEIRRSRFLVADFTQGESGARGGVYYEAGFAHGLGIPVIFTCRKDCLNDLHFDTSHFSHIVWENPDDLRVQLRNRILAVIGQGPENFNA